MSDPIMQRSLTAATEMGSSNCLNTLPVETFGYSVNKQEFHDSVALRHGFTVGGTSAHCACGKTNRIDHALVCKLGDCTIRRHNDVRNR